MKEYDSFIDENSDILEFIVENDLTKKLDFADADAKLKSRRDGNMYLHSYRYSTVYNTLKKNIHIEGFEYGKTAIAIVGLLENEYDKTISDLVEDSIYKKDMEMSY